MRCSIGGLHKGGKGCKGVEWVAKACEGCRRQWWLQSVKRGMYKVCVQLQTTMQITSKRK